MRKRDEGRGENHSGGSELWDEHGGTAMGGEHELCIRAHRLQPLSTALPSTSSFVRNVELKKCASVSVDLCLI